MKTAKCFYAGLILAASSTACLSAEFIKGVYSSEEGCAAVANTRPELLEEFDFLILTADGVTGYEYGCEFLDIHSGRETPGWVAVAYCSEPGLTYPELISITPVTEESLDELQLGFLSDQSGISDEDEDGEDDEAEGQDGPDDQADNSGGSGEQPENQGEAGGGGENSPPSDEDEDGDEDENADASDDDDEEDEDDEELADANLFVQCKVVAN
jgi:hypothetical protein